MSELILIVVSAALVNNLALTHLVGITPLMATTRRLDMARHLGLALIVTLPVTTLATRLLDTLWLTPQQLTHFRLLGFVGLSALLLIGLQALCSRRSQDHATLGRALLPLLLASNIVLGTALLNQRLDPGWLQSLGFGLGSGLGFALILLLFAAQRERLAAADIPRPFRGAAIDFISLGLTAMAFLGLAGLFRT